VNSHYIAQSPTHISISFYHLLLAPAPDPLLILLPLRLDIPEPSPTLSLPARLALSETSIESQKRIRIALTQYRFSFPRVLALRSLAFSRYLAGPLRVLNRPQRLRGHYDAGGEEEDGQEELKGNVGGEWGRGESGCVFVGGVDTAHV